MNGPDYNGSITDAIRHRLTKSFSSKWHRHLILHKRNNLAINYLLTCNIEGRKGNLHVAPIFLFVDRKPTSTAVNIMLSFTSETSKTCIPLLPTSSIWSNLALEQVVNSQRTFTRKQRSTNSDFLHEKNHTPASPPSPTRSSRYRAVLPEDTLCNLYSENRLMTSAIALWKIDQSACNTKVPLL